TLRSGAVAAASRPSREKANEEFASGEQTNERSSLPPATSQTRTVRSLPNESSVLPSGAKCSCVGGGVSRGGNRRSILPAAASQRMIERSARPALASVLPSGDQASAATAPVCPAGGDSSLPVATS